MGEALTTWRELMSEERSALRAAAAGADARDVAVVSRLRKLGGAELVRAALELASARRKLESKWPERAARMIADEHGAEMASSEMAARHKAARLAERLEAGAAVVDLCCGIGADAVALVEAGMSVTAVDIDPVRAWMAGINAACDSTSVDVADVEQLPAAAGFHLDPSRRSEESGRRRHGLDEHVPGPRVWRDVVKRYGGAEACAGAIKLGPGVDVGEVREALATDRFEIEYISERGRMTQAVVWMGKLAGEWGRVRSTRLEDVGEVRFSISGAAEERGGGPVWREARAPRFLLEADAAVERAGLLGIVCAEVGAAELHAGLGLLATDDEGFRSSDLVTGFEVLHAEAWNERRALAWLRGEGAGVVEVKTRGKAVEPDSLQKRLSKDGLVTHTVFVLRLGTAMRAFFTRRVSGTGGA